MHGHGGHRPTDRKWHGTLRASSSKSGASRRSHHCCRMVRPMNDDSRGAAALNDYGGRTTRSQSRQQQISARCRGHSRFADSFRVDWTEQHYEDGKLAHGAMTAILTIVIQRRASDGSIEYVGIYVNAISWSRELGHERSIHAPPLRLSCVGVMLAGLRDFKPPRSDLPQCAPLPAIPARQRPARPILSAPGPSRAAARLPARNRPRRERHATPVQHAAKVLQCIQI